jgi:hypothetical protein
MCAVFGFGTSSETGAGVNLQSSPRTRQTLIDLEAYIRETGDTEYSIDVQSLEFELDAQAVTEGQGILEGSP